MNTENRLNPLKWGFNHPFFVILGIIIIIYAGYIFGVRLHELIR
jgi:hypothetical protein